MLAHSRSLSSARHGCDTSGSQDSDHKDPTSNTCCTSRISHGRNLASRSSLLLCFSTSCLKRRVIVSNKSFFSAQDFEAMASSREGATNHDDDDEQVAVVCCSCFRSKSKSLSASAAVASQQEKKQSAPSSSRRGLAASSSIRSRRSSIYFEAQDGIIEEASLEFFDAMEELDDDDEYKDDSVDAYPIITRAFKPQKSFRVSFMDPKTLLRNETTNGTDRQGMAGFTRQSSFARRGSVEVTKDLQEPEVTVQERGYPGQLDGRELMECQSFYREVTRRKGTIRDIVFAYKNIEDEPYTICRFLRPTKFVAADMLARLEANKTLWEKAAKADFYQDLESAMGIPPSLFSRFYPFFYQGNAKNGCPVNYFKAGKIHVDGLLSMITMEQVSYNAWNVCKHVFPSMVSKAQDKDPNFVRCESINVIDLQGLTSQQASSEAIEIVKQATKVADFFPETMHCMIILNAPTWFSVTWRVIRSFLDPRTARKIEVYTNTSRGQFRLQQLIHATEIPHDFGGMGPPTGSSEGPDRQALQILHVSKKHRAIQEVPCLADVGEDEKITSLKVFSRSATGIIADFAKDGDSIASDFSINPPKAPASGTSLDPYVFDIIKEPIDGPCQISLTARALPDEKKPPNKSSFGYFVVVAFITLK